MNPPAPSPWWGGLGRGDEVGTRLNSLARAFQHLHNRLHLRRIIKHPPRRPQPLLPIDANKLAAIGAKLLAHPIDLRLLASAKRELIILIQRRRLPPL